MMLAYQLIAIADRLNACTISSLQPIVERHPSEFIRAEAQALMERVSIMTEQASDTSDICTGISRLLLEIDILREDVQQFIRKL